MFLGQVNDLRKGGAIVDGQFGQHLPVDDNARFLQPVHQLAVGDAIQAGGGVDSGDPQLAEVPPAQPPVNVGIMQRLHHLLVRRAV